MRPTKPLRDHTYEELDALQRACFNDRYETERTLDAIAREAAKRFADSCGLVCHVIKEPTR